VDLATASFPCTDLSLAGNRAGLSGRESGSFWHFARVLEEMAERRPRVVLLENVIGFATSHGGEDMHVALSRLNSLGYYCDLFTLDARWFVPQSRPRLFIVGSLFPPSSRSWFGDWQLSPLRPPWILRFVMRHSELALLPIRLPVPLPVRRSLDSVVERISPEHPSWWDEPRLGRFLEGMTELQFARTRAMLDAPRLKWATAYRRTRHGRAVWEVRPDDISGCLRTARGGSSKQALVEAGDGQLRVRWMTAREYARLQGADDYNISGVTENKALFGLGDAVCVPAVEWIAEHCLGPLLSTEGTTDEPFALLSVNG
jgi:DNA (cytosine-5)-methyltransferase 1